MGDSFVIDRRGALVDVVDLDGRRECRRHPGHLARGNVDRRGRSPVTRAVRGRPGSGDRHPHRHAGATRGRARSCGRPADEGARSCSSCSTSATRPSRRRGTSGRRECSGWCEPRGFLDQRATTGSTSADVIVTSTSPGRRRRSPPSSTASSPLHAPGLRRRPSPPERPRRRRLAPVPAHEDRARSRRDRAFDPISPRHR